MQGIVSNNDFLQFFSSHIKNSKCTLDIVGFDNDIKSKSISKTGA